MKMRAHHFVFVAMSLLPLSSFAEGEAAPPPQSPGVVHKVGTAVEEGAQAAADGVKKGVRAAAGGIERGAEAAAHGVKRGVEAAAEGVERGAKATAAAAGRVAEKVSPSSSGAPAPVSEVPPPAQK